MSDHKTIIEGGLPVKAWVKGVEFEDEAKKQLLNLSRMPFIHKHIAVLPDVHAGKGSTIGSVIPTKNVIIPASVGVDLGCGCMAIQTSLTSHDLPENLSELRAEIERRVPHGRTNNGGPGDRGAWATAPKAVASRWHMDLEVDYQNIIDKHPKIAPRQHPTSHLGTLGTGNHFVEVCLDKTDQVWVMLHSGSRGIGNKIGSYFIDKAKEEMRRWHIHLEDQDLAYLPEGSQYFDDYVEAVDWAQKFALQNRDLMMDSALAALHHVIPKPFVCHCGAVNCHHNYVQKERHYGENVWLTRKGAVSAQEGQLGIIPGSMGARSFIVRGKGNRESFCSCSHGAGRKMSRNKARELFTVEDHKKATAGIECRKDIEVIDETPAAYKDIESVMKAQEDLVEVVHELRQIVCVKG